MYKQEAEPGYMKQIVIRPQLNQNNTIPPTKNIQLVDKRWEDSTIKKIETELQYSPEI